VIDVVIVEVDGLLDQPETEGIEKEVEVGLSIVYRRGDVVQAENRVAVCNESLLVPLPAPRWA
jgi:hypothetical protein